MSKSRLNATQKEYLLKAVDHLPQMVTQQFSVTFTRDKYNKLWGELANVLNEMGECKKDAQGWRKSFLDLRSSAKKKKAEQAKAFAKTGCGMDEEDELVPISPSDEMILSIGGGRDLQVLGDKNVSDFPRARRHYEKETIKEESSDEDVIFVSSPIVFDDPSFEASASVQKESTPKRKYSQSFDLSFGASSSRCKDEEEDETPQEKFHRIFSSPYSPFKAIGSSTNEEDTPQRNFQKIFGTLNTPTAVKESSTVTTNKGQETKKQKINFVTPTKFDSLSSSTSKTLEKVIAENTAATRTLTTAVHTLIDTFLEVSRKKLFENVEYQRPNEDDIFIKAFLTL